MMQELTLPNYSVLKKYFNDPIVNEIYFESNFKILRKRPQFEQFTELLKSYQISDPNLCYFWVHYSATFEYAKSFTEVKLFDVWNKHNRDLRKLKELSKTLNEKEKKSILLHSLSIKVGAGKNAKTISITSYPLLYDMFTYLQKWIAEQPLGNEQTVRNKNTYFKQFIQRTKPLFNYLRATCFKKETETYARNFIVRFLETAGVDWVPITDLPEEYIKDRFKEKSK